VEKIKSFSLFTFFFIATLLPAASGSFGETIRWSSPAKGGDTRFSNPANWNKARVPQSGDTVVFDSVANGSAACVLDIDATVAAVAFRNNYTSLFDFSGHFLTVLGTFADFRSTGEIDGTNNSGGVVFSGSSVQDFFPGKAHFPCIIVKGTDSDSIICREIGMLTDTLILSGGTLVCGNGLSHLCGEVRGTGGSLDFGSSSISVSGAGVFLSGLASVNARTGTLICTGTGSQRVEFPADSLSLHAFIQNCPAGCVFAGGGICCIDSCAIQSGSLAIADSQSLTVGTFAIVHGRIQMTRSGCVIVQKSADLSGLDTAYLQGTLGFSGESVAFIPKAGACIAAISLLRGKVNCAGNGCDAGELHLSDAARPCTLSLGTHLTHSFHSIFAGAGSVIDFGTSTLRFEGDTLDFSHCGAMAGQSGDGALSFSGSGPQVFIPNKIVCYPSIFQKGAGKTTVCRNDLSCRRLTIQGGTFNLGKGFSHTVTNLLRVQRGGLDFGSSTLNAAADTIDLSGANDLAAGSGILSFIGATGSQIFIPAPKVQHPDLTKSQNGTVRVSGALRAKNFWMSAGTFDPGVSRCEFTGFSAKGGTFVTGSDSLIITGNANFSDLSNLVPGSAPIVVRASGSSSTAVFSSTSQAIGNLVLSALPSPAGIARVVAGKGMHRVYRLTFQWNRSGDSAIFDFRQNSAGIVSEGPVGVASASASENSGSDKGSIFMGNGTWTFAGDVALSNNVADSSTVTFCRQDAAQTIAIAQPLNNVIHSGNGSLVLARQLKCRNFTQSGGLLNFKGSSIDAANDFSLLSGSSIAVPSLPWKISAGRNAFITGTPDSLMPISGTPACTIGAARSLIVRYSVLKHCVAVLTKGTAYNCIDSGGNSGWTFITRPLPIGISSRNISFGTVSAGSSRDTTVTLSNICGDTITVFLVQVAGAAFSGRGLWGNKIPPHQSIIDTVLYAPDDAGPDSGMIIFQSNAESSPDTVLLHGTGRGPRLRCSLDTISLSSGAVSKQVFRTVVLKNSGTDTMFLSQTIQSADHSIGLDSIFCVSALRACAPQDSLTDTIRFIPAKEGVFSALLILKTNCPVPYDTILITARVSAAAVSDDQKPVLPGSYSFQEISEVEKSVLFKYGLPAASKVTLEIYDAIRIPVRLGCVTPFPGHLLLQAEGDRRKRF
jgi:hypothetical protein